MASTSEKIIVHGHSSFPSLPQMSASPPRPRLGPGLSGEACSLLSCTHTHTPLPHTCTITHTNTQRHTWTVVHTPPDTLTPVTHTITYTHSHRVTHHSDTIPPPHIPHTWSHALRHTCTHTDRHKTCPCTHVLVLTVSHVHVSGDQNTSKQIGKGSVDGLFLCVLQSGHLWESECISDPVCVFMRPVYSKVVSCSGPQTQQLDRAGVAPQPGHLPAWWPTAGRMSPSLSGANRVLPPWVRMRRKPDSTQYLFSRSLLSALANITKLAHPQNAGAPVPLQRCLHGWSCAPGWGGGEHAPCRGGFCVRELCGLEILQACQDPSLWGLLPGGLRYGAEFP